MSGKITVTEGGEPRVMGGAHEAASRISRELSTWLPAARSADGDILHEKAIVDARSIDLSRNDAFVAAGAALHKDNVVGAQFRLNLKPNLRILGQDETWGFEFAEEVEALFEAWAESPRNWVDAARRNTFSAMIRLAVGVYLHSGEVLMTSEWLSRGRNKARPYYTAFQMIELARLCNPQDQAYNQDRVRGGIEFDVHGAPLAYYIRRSGLGERMLGYDAYRWSRIRLENSFGRPQVLHVMEQQRPSQSRGMSQMVAALKEMRTTKRYRDLRLQKAALNASFLATIESEMATSALYESLGGKSSEAVQEQFTKYGQGYLSAILEYVGDSGAMQLDGVRIPHLFPGTKLNFDTAKNPDNGGEDFEASMIRYIAACLDVSYEELSRDYRRSSYSSARAGMLNTWRAAQSRKSMIVNRIAGFILRNWFEEALAQNRFSTMRGRTLPNFYENEEAYLRATWIGGVRGQIDEEKETKAAILRLRSGLSTWEDELARFGKDFREVFMQRAREEKLLEDLGISLVELESTQAPDPEEDTGDGGNSAGNAGDGSGND